MTEDESRAADAGTPGSVAEEAALLVELLTARGWGLGADRPDPSESRGDDPTGRAAATGECTCGGTTPAACRVCPVCQVISFVQQISPDTIERFADIVDLAATGLRDLAAAQRDRHGTRAGATAQEAGPG